MAQKKKAPEKAPEDESLLVSAAKSIGKAAGTIAAASGLASSSEPPPAHPRQRRSKLAPKSKARLPRRQKKVQKKMRSAAL